MKKKVIYHILISIFLILSVTGVSAQEKGLVIRGQIKSAKGDAVPMVNVVEIDANNRFVSGTITDLNGNYMLKVTHANTTIVLNCMGYTSDTVKISNESVKNITLNEKITDLGEIEIKAAKVVNNGMFDRNAKDVLSAVSVLDMKDVEDLGAASVEEALQGRLTNVDVTYNSGDPGSAMTIKMRNVSSLTSTTSPLIVIDDVPQSMTVDPAFNFGTANDQEYGTLLNIDPQDIESIVALTDAASASVYGSRGGNGVLLIKTKRGKPGKTRVTFALKYTVSKQPNSIPMLNGDEYTGMILESFINKGGVASIPSSTNEFSYVPNNSSWTNYYNYNKNTDWLKEITQTGLTKNGILTVQGGGQKAQYLYSLGYLDQGGTTMGTSFKRLSNRVNFDYRISDKLKILADISYTNSTTDGNLSNVRDVAFRRMPNLSIYQYDVNGNMQSEYFSAPLNGLIQADLDYKYYEDLSKEKITYNPVAMINLSSDDKLKNTVNTRFGIFYNILPTLRYTANIAFTSDNEKTKTFVPYTATGLIWNDGASNKATNQTTENFDINMQNGLSFLPKIGEKHSVAFNAKVLNVQSRGYSQKITVTNSPNPYLNEVVTPATVNTLENAKSIYKGIDLIGNIFYSFMERYKLEATYSTTANSNRGENKLWDNNFGLSIGWDISKEAFMQKQKAITQLQVRANMGIVGSPVGKKSNQNVSIGTNKYIGNYLGFSSLVPQNIQEVSLRPERKKEFDYGLDLELFQNIYLTINLYNSKRTDQYNTVNLPSSAGFTSYGINEGASTTKGFDMYLNASVVKTKDLLVQLRFNFANSVTEYTKLNANGIVPDADMLVNGHYIDTRVLNKPDGAFYGYHYLGVYSKTSDANVTDANGNVITDYNGYPKRIIMGGSNYMFTGGDARYEDKNHDGVINKLDVSYLGTKAPDFYGSIGPNIKYKNIVLTLFFNYRYGNSIINSMAMNTQKMYGMDNQSKAVLSRWRKEGDVTDVPRAVWKSGYNWLGSDRFVEDGSFIRFKQLSLSYTFDNKFIRKLRLSSLKVLATGSNLYTWTKYTGQDPEALSNGLYDNGYTPPSKNFLFGIDVTF